MMVKAECLEICKTTSVVLLLLVTMQMIAYPQSDQFYEATRDSFWRDIWVRDRSGSLRDKQGRNDWKYEDRSKVDDASVQYLTTLKTNYNLLEDPFVEDYLTRVLHLVVSSNLVPSRPGTPNIKIVKNATPNAFALNDGTILITTGMLSLVRTENELKGILAHEVAHIVLDHNLENFSSAKSAQALSEFMGVVGAAIGGYVAAKTSSEGMSREYYQRHVSNAIIGGGLLFYSVTRTVLEIVGAAYGRSQEEKADLIARDFLRTLSLPDKEYGDLLYRLGRYSLAHGMSAGASIYDDHPSIKDRLEELQYDSKGYLQDKKDFEFDRNIAEILMLNASIQIHEGKYSLATENVDRAIKSGWAVEETYLLAAIALRHLESDKVSTERALELLDEAEKRKTVGHALLHSERALLYMRQRDYGNAKSCFEKYLGRLSEMHEIDVSEETTWAKRMLAKCNIELQKKAE